jgi:hypothetical protein
MPVVKSQHPVGLFDCGDAPDFDANFVNIALISKVFNA